ncbi:MAG TPA: hypothetical protein VNS09_08470 [Solirubrobacter sp.]|nr:hypothetical protein [Solirubrobacter sp.]
MPKLAVDRLTLFALLGTVGALAACGSSESRDPSAPKVAAATDVQVPGDGDGGGAKADVADVQAAVSSYMSAVADGDGEAACDQMTEEAVAGVVDDGKKRDADAAYRLCAETIGSLASIMDDADRAGLREAKFEKTEIDGDTATVVVSIGDGPVELVRTEDGWLLNASPA